MNELCSLYSIADACVVTSIRDGMNLVCQEYVVCQLQRRGVLILSEFTGSASSLSGSLMINPWNTEEVADALHQALSMPPKERLEKHQMQFKYVAKHTAAFWGMSFVGELQHASSQADQITNVSSLNKSQVLESYAKSNRRLLIFAYDGTLVPFYSIPSLCYPSAKLQSWLSILGKDPRNLVFVCSGRDRRTLELWLGKTNVGLSAEFGCFLRRPGTREWEQMVSEIDSSWKDTIRPMFDYFQTRTPGSFFEEKEMHLTWHYRNADPTFGSIQARELLLQLDNLPVEVIVGDKNIAVRNYSVNTAGLIKKAIQDLTPNGLDMVLVVGDMQTHLGSQAFPQVSEESLFSCSVGKRTKSDKYYLNDSKEVGDLLACMMRESERFIKE